MLNHFVLLLLLLKACLSHINKMNLHFQSFVNTNWSFDQGPQSDLTVIDYDYFKFMKKDCDYTFTFANRITIIPRL